MIMTVSSAPIVSVVTPFYNSGDTLERCIDSVLSQSRVDFEYVLADNCSSDRSAEIARDHAQRDSRIRYLQFEDHLPKVSNYNRALRMISAATRFCKIVQADDFLYPECLERMLDVALRHPNVGIVGARRMAGAIIDPPPAKSLPPVCSGREICRQVLRGEVYPFGSPTSVMYRADLVRSLHPDFFDGRLYFDDVDVVLNLLRTTDFAFCEQVLTYTQRDPASTFGRVMQYFPSLLNQYVMLRRWGADFFSTEELNQLLDVVAREYYEALIRASSRADRVELFRFHRALLAGAGFRWELGRVCTAFAVLAGGWLVRRGRATLRRRT
jgi:glycosyltransferase involved in cell wall biosynthesis